MIALFLYDRLATSDSALIANLTHHALNWRRSTRAIGGYYLGDFTITTATMPRIDIWSFFQNNIGRRIVERTAGTVSWEGEIAEMDLQIDNITWRITLNQERFHNKVNVYYTDATTGSQASSGWSENTDSSDIYGESCYIDVVGQHYDSTVATARRDRRLVEFAYPQSIPVGDLTARADPTIPPTLTVRVQGYCLGMNRRYQTADISATALSSQIATLVGYSEYIAAGRIETNSLSVPISCADSPRSLWDLIAELIAIGDAAGDRWIGGVYADRQFIYEEARTTVSHYWRRGQLITRANTPVIPSLITPDMVVQLSAAVPGEDLPGAQVWDSPRNVWIEEVEFEVPDRYRLIPYGGSAFGAM